MSGKVGWLAEGYLKDWLRYRYEREEIPGFVIAVARDGNVIFNEAYGYADLEKKEKMTTGHIFRIASHSKTFTATAVMQLQEQGKLKIDDPIVNYLPWLKNHKDKRWLEVTIAQVLSYSAGIIRDGEDSDYWQLYRSFPDKEQLKKDFLQTDLVLNAGTKMKYSNYGYSLLGALIEEVSGKPYNKYVVEHIVKLLNLKDTGPELNKSIENKLVTGYSGLYNKKRLPIEQIDTQAMSPATGFYSTSEDLCAYFSAQMVGSGKLLSDESKRAMQSKHVKTENTGERGEYGLGFEIDYVDRKKVFGHGGGFPGHITKTIVYPKNKLVVTVLTNSLGSGASYIAKGIMSTINYAHENNKPTKKDFLRYEGRFMSIWSAMDFVSVEGKLIVAQPYGWTPFDKAVELKYVKDNVFEIVKTDSFDHEGEKVYFTFSKNGKVKSVLYGGETLLPEKEYMDKILQKKNIGLPEYS
jgi:D-alanyl-D-alanine carboxypeptidase